MAGAATEDEDVVVAGVAVDEEVVVGGDGVDAGLHFCGIGFEAAEVVADAGGEFGGVFCVGGSGRMVWVDGLAQVLVVADLEAAAGGGHAVPASGGVEDEDG